MTLKVLEEKFAVCKVADFSQVNFEVEFLFMERPTRNYR